MAAHVAHANIGSGGASPQFISLQHQKDFEQATLTPLPPPSGVPPTGLVAEGFEDYKNNRSVAGISVHSSG